MKTAYMLHSPKKITRFLVLFLAFLCFENFALAGPKVKRLKQNAKKVKVAVLVIAPILPDSFVLAKLQKKGGDAVQIYLDDLKEANKNLVTAFTQKFSFCRTKFMVNDPNMQTYESYFATLKSMNPDSFYVLQFGQAEQYVSGVAVRIKTYDRDVIAIDKTDGKSRMIISAGSVEHMWKEDYAFSVALTFQHNLEVFYKMAQNSRKRR